MEKILIEGYYIEYNGEYYQSVFPSGESEKSYPHTSVKDALNYMVNECGIKREQIKIIK